MPDVQATAHPPRRRAPDGSPSSNGSRPSRVPPHALDAEESLLGAAMLSADALEILATRTRPEDFYKPAHQHVAAVLVRSFDEGRVADSVTVAEELRRAGLLEQIGGAAVIAQIMSSTPATSNAGRYAELVAGPARIRRKLYLAASAIEKGYAGDEVGMAQYLDEAAFEPTSRQRLEGLLLSGDEIETIPRPEPLLDGILYRKSLAVLFGKPGGGKSFLALDWAASIASGSWWMKREIHPGPVLYVAAEGAEGLGMRLRAWKTSRNIADVSRLEWLPSTVNLFAAADVAELVTLLKRRPYALVVIDTLARCIVGADENSAKDMGIVIDALERIRAATNATVLIVHHTPRGGENARGSTALEGAVDTMIKVKGEEGRLLVECEKQKNATKFLPVHLRLESLGDSAVLTRTSGDPADDERMTARCAELLRLLESMDTGHGISSKDWEGAALEKHGIARTLYFEARKVLHDKELVKQAADNQRAPWCITDQGKATLAPRPEQM